jgi:hypothetical protein
MDVHISLVLKEAIPQSVREDCAYLLDNFLAGPSRWSRDAHVDARARYFGGTNARWSEAYAVLDRLRGADTVCVWGIEAWSSRLALAFLCAQRTQLFRGARIVRIDLPATSLISGVCCSVPRKSKRNVERRILTEDEIASGKAFWRTFTAANPQRLFVDLSWSLFPRPRKFLAFVRSLFPRRNGGRNQLSELDVSLLSSAARRSVSAVDLFGSSSAQSLGARRWAHCSGDAMLASRLRAWAQYPEGEPALALVANAESSLFRSRYHLTSRGRSLLKELSDLSEAPVCPFGGTHAYDVEHPFFIPAGRTRHRGE